MSPRDLVRSTPLRLAVAFRPAIVAPDGRRFRLRLRGDDLGVDFAIARPSSPTRRQKPPASDDDRLRRALSLRLTRDFRRLNFVALYDPSGQLVFGNLDRKPDIPVDGRTHYLPDFRATETGEPEPTLLVARARPNGDVIVLGRSVVGSRNPQAHSRPRALLRHSADRGRRARRRIFPGAPQRRANPEIDRAIAEIVKGDLRARLPSRFGHRRARRRDRLRQPNARRNRASARSARGRRRQYRP